jgi:hypothetical protein
MSRPSMLRLATGKVVDELNLSPKIIPFHRFAAN